ncbi:UPF0057-domain-containing protein [Polychaeton citri CBS 116435]|uniref:UPF0057-domain-containing protein n=1 Tax=Polychaeton citri CBS 116435 TaxID=1314669 RepID=A0A9P4Q8H8_9PEZI|nr:UPF0057-domain-containing protein [Polychaeton citri CBS 116435]
MCGSDIFLGFIAILFPPLAVWVKRGICSADSFINIALCCLGFLPGLIHALYIIAVTPDPTYEGLPQDAEGGRVTYYFVQGQPSSGRRQSQSGRQRAQGYGTVNSTPSSQFPISQDSGFIQPPQDGPSNIENPPSYQQAIKGDHKIQKP